LGSLILNGTRKVPLEYTQHKLCTFISKETEKEHVTNVNKLALRFALFVTKQNREETNHIQLDVVLFHLKKNAL
jgi:hypothetical protein